GDTRGRGRAVPPGSGARLAVNVFDRLSGRVGSRHEDWLRPHRGPTPPQEMPFGVGGRSGALRAAIFGINDGLVSNLSLIMGVSGATVSNRFVIVGGVAGLLAGELSLGDGEADWERGHTRR